LTEEEYQQIIALLGREPNGVEIALFSVMWSEHCSYKSSKVHLKRFPTTGERVVCGPGENAGVVDIGNGYVAAFKIESHNHPSFIEPFQGAATGVGGILRDIFTMGARPIALLNSLRFGPIENPKNKRLMEQVVSGISVYGNSVGVPTVGGEVNFGETYAKNPLVNVFCMGIARRKDIIKGIAAGVGNPVIYFGSKTGRDGIHGATMASTGLDRSKESRPAVQVGDPFTEKLLLEAAMELIQTGCVIGMSDMGAAGLTCASAEMASRGGVGMTIDLSKVPLRETGMIPMEILISESQERMLVCIEKGREDEATAVFKKWDLDFAVIGFVTDDGMLRVTYHTEPVAQIPVEALTNKAPVYERPIAQPGFQDMITSLNHDVIPKLPSYSETLMTLLASPSFACRRWVYQQYDYMVQTNTVVGPGSGAAILRLKESDVQLAITLDSNSTYTLLHPYYGGAIAVAEAARNLVAVGAKPIGMTNCMNFGNPERPETMWAFGLAVEGMSDVCRTLGIPVIGGNVSLYNETAGLDIYPTPVVGMVGLIEPLTRPITPIFQSEGEVLVLIGDTMEELGGSAYLKEIYSQERGTPPMLRLEREKAVQNLILQANGFLSSAQDLSEGGLAMALAKGCILSKMGCSTQVDTGKIRHDAMLFGESQSRFLVSLSEENLHPLKELLNQADLPYLVLGTTGGDSLKIAIDGSTVVVLSVCEMEAAYRNGLARYFGAR
jgi:phosphoribosylformylglycinamidine synthase